MSTRLSVAVHLALLFAFTVDVSLAMVTWVMPGLWFELLHGAPPDALEQALFRRSGAQWAAIAALSLLALTTWRWLPSTLLLAAGALFTDTLTDVVYLASLVEPQWPAWLFLIPAGPVNLALGALLVYAYDQATALPEASDASDA